jgi:hypothetical protein
MNHYQCAHFFVLETGVMGISELHNIFPQQCIMPTFTRKEHVTAANNKLKEAICNHDGN